VTVTDATEHFGIEVTSEATIVISGELDLATSRQLTSSFDAVLDRPSAVVVRVLTISGLLEAFAVSPSEA